MPPSENLPGIAQNILCRARRQGFVVAREVREEVAQAGIPDTLWKEVLELARPQLRYQHGRYYYLSPVVANLRKNQRSQRTMQYTIRRMVREYRLANTQLEERRWQTRVKFFYSVTVLTADQRRLRFIGRDISLAGVCLIGTCSLQGQRIQVLIPGARDVDPSRSFSVQVLWSSEVADNLFESGGIFVEMIGSEQNGS